MSSTENIRYCRVSDHEGTKRILFPVMEMVTYSDLLAYLNGRKLPPKVIPTQSQFWSNIDSSDRFDVARVAAVNSPGINTSGLSARVCFTVTENNTLIALLPNHEATTWVYLPNQAKEAAESYIKGADCPDDEEFGVVIFVDKDPLDNSPHRHEEHLMKKDHEDPTRKTDTAEPGCSTGALGDKEQLDQNMIRILEEGLKTLLELESPQTPHYPNHGFGGVSPTPPWKRTHQTNMRPEPAPVPPAALHMVFQNMYFKMKKVLDGSPGKDESIFFGSERKPDDSKSRRPFDIGPGSWW